ncbi:hypothetical protein HLPR_18790 [Helicovermis profundi]|uniref:Uncharacterized protein n=1 Tax=Helicovermis profundi TaxID=3065157 RepID=A0AAU9E7Z2_9FIRM|nr:hypothetical protein HLPR_18790 [Clostridia bacterium S502]
MTTGRIICTWYISREYLWYCKKKIDFSKLEMIRNTKREERGGFNDDVIL